MLRVAELLEGALWDGVEDALELLELYRQLSPEQQAQAKDICRRLASDDQS